MKVLKVPLPANIYDFANSFPNTVPLIVSTKEGTSEQYGYWLLCDDKEEEEKIVKSLGLDYETYKLREPMIASASSFPPIYDLKLRADEIKRLTNSTLKSDKSILSLYQYAPDLQSPIICPKSLAKVDSGFSFTVMKTEKKFYGVYSSTSDMKAFDIGCRELRDALQQPGNPLIQEISIPDSEKPSQISDLNCKNGLSLEPQSFVSLCNEARSGKAPDDLLTLNALIVKLGLITSNSCDQIYSSIGTYFTSETNKNFDLSNSALKSLTLFQYLPAIYNVKVLKLNDNPKLGETDSTSKAVIDSLSAFIGLTQLNIKGTAIANLTPLRDLQFLDKTGVEADWFKILPEACELSSISSSLRTACTKLQIPISLGLEGGTTRFVAKASEIDFTLSAFHELVPSENNIFSLSLNRDRTSCEGVTVDGLHVSGGKVPEQSCVISVTVKANGGHLISSTLDITVNRLGTCDGHEVDTGWDESFPATNPDRKVHFLCQRQGTTVIRVIESGSCNAPEYDFVKDSQTGSCFAKRCPGLHDLGSDWPIDTTDSLGSYRLTCVLQEGKPTPIFKENSGSCLNPNKYDFVVTNKSCALVRCENKKSLNSSWFEDSPSTPNANQEYTCTSAGEIVAKGSFVCKSGFLKRGNQCLLACDSANDHAIGDPAWPGSNGKFVCNADKVVLSSCNDNYLPRDGICKKSCGGGHAVGDANWPEKNGTYRCEEAGPVLVSCDSNYLKSGSGVCTLSCDGIHLPENGAWETGRNTRKITYSTCAADGSKVPSFTCMTGYDSTDGKECYQRCDGHIHGSPWPGTTRHGSFTNTCNDGTASAGAITCEANFTEISGSCYRNCGSNHIEGTATATWTEGTGANYRWTCTETGATQGEFVGCDSGYTQEGNSCRKNPPEPECRTGAIKCDPRTDRKSVCRAGKWEVTGNFCTSTP